MPVSDPIEAFLDGANFAVVGASADRSKYGNKVLRTFLQHGMQVYPVNPNATEIEGLQAYDNLSELPTKVHGVSIITPPPVTMNILQEAARLGIRHVWMQPGAESPEAIDFAEAAGMNVVAGGPCILVRLRFRDS